MSYSNILWFPEQCHLTLIRDFGIRIRMIHSAVLWSHSILENLTCRYHILWSNICTIAGAHTDDTIFCDCFTSLHNLQAMSGFSFSFIEDLEPAEMIPLIKYQYEKNIIYNIWQSFDFHCENSIVCVWRIFRLSKMPHSLEGQHLILLIFKVSVVYIYPLNSVS